MRMHNMNKGIENALKMREMFEKDEYSGASLHLEYPDVIFLYVHPFNGLYYERSIRTYQFKPDGSYTSQANT